MKCNRCKSEIATDADESCWFCTAPLCYECWNLFGHCGHKKADATNEATRAFGRVWDETHNEKLANAKYREVMAEYGF